MANKFFENFPKLQYKLDDGRIIYIKDWFRKTKIEQEAVNSIVSYNKYEILDGERPDIVATKLYGNPDLHWTFFLVNDFENYYDWHKDSVTFENYINKKYPGSFLIGENRTDILSGSDDTVSKFLLGETVTQGNRTGHVTIVDPIGKRMAIDVNNFVSNVAVTGSNSGKSFTPVNVINQRDGVHHYQNSDGIIRNESLAGFTAKTFYDYEFELNEAKRSIKVIDPSRIKQIVRRFEKIMLS